MRCEEWRKLLVDRLAGELAAEDAAGLQRHLDQCPVCVEEEARLRFVMTAAAPPLSEAPDLSAMEARLVGEMRRLKEASGGRRAAARGFIPLLLRIPIPSYAVLLLVIGAVAGGFWLGRLQGGPKPGDVAGGRSASMNYPAADTAGASFRLRAPGGEESPKSATTRPRVASWAQFATAPGDGIALAATPPADTL